MRAIRVSKFGGPGVLEYVNIEDPVAGPYQVVVELAVSDITSLDDVIRSGKGQEPQSLPYIPGCGGAGVVIAVGEEVDPRLLGSRVVVRTTSGCYAEKVACSLADITQIPDDLDFVQAAALIHDGVDAALLIEEVGVLEDDWVLVVGAASGVGYMLARAAMQAGANVVGVDKGREKLRFMLEEQIEHVVDYSDPDWCEKALAITSDIGFMLVMDGIGGEIGAETLDLINRSGAYLNFSHERAPGEPSQFMCYESYVVHHYRPYTNLIERGSISMAMAKLAQDKCVQMYSSVTATYALDEVWSAHNNMAEQNVVGKHLLLINPQLPVPV